ncbi:MAG: acyl-ACP--UDP-N-acetylglucosamine O-acyltransferase [Burkholderiales bacterium]|nr:acyl-ACP--UDP-N-acetylglucosamine O-acyltransferase [Burkholderiales bacterium]
MSSAIHPTAIVHSNARLGAGVSIGAYSIIDAQVEIGAGTCIGHHCVVTGRTAIGCDNRIFHFVSLGEMPQDKKYGGEPTRLEIGDRNTIREFCTFNRGTQQDAGVTRLGHDNWIMAYVHLAHDCQVGNHTVFANNAQLAGHVHVGDYAILGGFTTVHQFCRIGAHCISGLSSVLVHDVPPYITVAGNPAAAHGINAEGLRRRGFSAAAIDALRRSYKTLYRSGLTLEQAKNALAEQARSRPEVSLLVEFLAESTRGIVR